MILTDTGPLVALLDINDHHHQRCLDAIKKLPTKPMLTTWPCFTEASHLLGTSGGYRYQEKLWRLHITGRLYIHTFSSIEVERMNQLMDMYQDTPMDLADASLVAVADSLNLKYIFSFNTFAIVFSHSK